MYRYIFSFTLKLITATLQKLAIFHTWKCKTKGWWNGPKHTSLSLWWIYDYKSANLNKKIFYLSLDFLNPETAWGGEGQFDHPCGFSKRVSSKEREKPWFFEAFNIIFRHIFPENFIEFPQVVQKIWRNSLSILAIFHQFSPIF